MKQHEKKSIFGVARRQLFQLPKICVLSAVFKQDFGHSAIASSSDVLGRLTANQKSVSQKAHVFSFLGASMPRGHGWHAETQTPRREVKIHSFSRLGKPKQLQTRKTSGKEKKTAFFSSLFDFFKQLQRVCTDGFTFIRKTVQGSMF
jgi:hypothetical protein